MKDSLDVRPQFLGGSVTEEFYGRHKLLYILPLARFDPESRNRAMGSSGVPVVVDWRSAAMMTVMEIVAIVIVIIIIFFVEKAENKGYNTLRC